MKLKHCFIVLFFWFILPNCFAAPYGLPEGKINWKHIGVNQGLPSSETYFVYQDKKGYIWICTDRGVVRFNGSKMKLFTTKNGLTDDVVFKVYEDFKGRIWFITYNGLLCYYDNGKIVKYKYNYHIVRFLKGYIATYKSFKVDRNETIYYSLKDLGGFTISKNGTFKTWKQYKSKRSIIRYSKIENDYFFTFKYQRNPTFIKNKYQDKFPVLIKYFKNNPTIVGEFDVQNQVQISNSGEFAYLNLGGNCINLNDIHKIERHKKLISISCEPKNVWLGFYNNGVERVPHLDFGISQRKKEKFLKNYSITSVLKDQHGGYWFSTLENGVFYTINPEIRYWNDRQVLRNKNVLKVRIHNKNLIVCSVDGYQIFSEFQRQFIPRNEMKTLDIWINGNNKLLLGGYTNFKEKINGGYTFKEDLSENKQIQEAINGFMQINPSIVLIKDNSETKDTIYSAVKNSKNEYHQFKSIIKGVGNNYYGGSAFGLFQIKKQQIFRMSQLDSRFKNRVVKLIFNDRLGLIVATRGIGVYFVKNNKIYLHLNKKKGLIDDNITDLHLDRQGRLYCSSYKGFSSILMKSNIPSICNVTKHHGLVSNEIESIFSKNDELWLGTKNGLLNIPLSYLKQIQKTAPLVFESIVVNGKEVNPKDASFDEGKLNFKLNFRSLEYRNFGHQKFRYRFSKNEKWNYSDKSTIVLTQPQSGEYKLEVSQLGLNGNWEKPQELIQFSILPPFYKQWYFITFIFLIIIGVIVVFYRGRLQNVNNKLILQKRVNELEQKALSAQMNPHFIFNSLNSIQSFLLYQENEKAEKYLLKFSKLIRATLANSRETFITIEQEIDLLKNYVELEQMRFQNRFDFEITVSDNLYHIHIPPMLIQPFVENAILHGLSKRTENGLLQISFTKKDTYIQVRVSDNGVGLNHNKTNSKSGHRSFGSDITKERMAIYEKNFNKSFRWEMNPNSENKEFPGVEVIIEIPINV